MATLPFTAIKTEKQYNDYTKKIIELLDREKRTKYDEEVIDLLGVLIEHYDMEHDTFGEADPVDHLKFIMDEHKMKPVQMAEFLGISKSLMSDILNYRRSFSKSMIRKLAERFKMRQDAFNRPYKLVNAKPASAAKKRAKKPVKVRK